MSDEQSGRGGFFQSKANITMVVFGAIAAFFLLTEHTAHVFGALPYLLLLACPLMHFFMHRGHGGHGGHGGHAGEDERKEAGREESGRRDS